MGSGVGPLAMATKSSKRSVLLFVCVRFCRSVVSGVARFAKSLKRFSSRVLTLRVEIGEARDQAERAISTSWLHALLRFHPWPIDVMVYHGSSGRPGFE